MEGESGDTSRYVNPETLPIRSTVRRLRRLHVHSTHMAIQSDFKEFGLEVAMCAMQENCRFCLTGGRGALNIVLQAINVIFGEKGSRSIGRHVRVGRGCAEECANLNYRRFAEIN